MPFFTSYVVKIALNPKFLFIPKKKQLFQSKTGKIEPDVQRASVIRATTDSPMSPPPLASIAPPLSRAAVMRNSGGVYSSPKSLYDIFMAQEKTGSTPDFAGRANGEMVANLYPDLKIEIDRGPRGEGMEVEWFWGALYWFFFVLK